MRPRVMRWRWTASVVGLLGGSVFLAGCVGGSAFGALGGVVVLVTALGLWACESDTSPSADVTDTTDTTDTRDVGHWEGYCSNGVWVDVWCTPDAPCNYWGGEVSWCEDGTCVEYPDTCEGEETCDGTWESTCMDGVITPICCPDGLACNYGMTLVDCGDGTCVTQPETCEPKDECDGYWESTCVDGAITPICCPAGMACNYGQTVVDCGEGTCVSQPETCPAEPVCDGQWESACQDNAIVQLCCPEGMACNYGELMVPCGDETCVNFPETCPGPER